MHAKPPTFAGHTQQPAPLRFGLNVSRTLNASYDRLRPVFKNITEKFFWSFVSLDMCGLWPGRFITGLIAGKKPYDVQQDPEAQNLPFSQQIRHWAANNIKGLNWPNCWEEVKREVIVAPGGILLVPTLTFMVGRRLLDTMIEIPFKTMKPLGEGFSDHLATTFPADTAVRSQEAYRQAVAKYLSGIFTDPLLKKTVVENATVRNQLKACPAVQGTLRLAGRTEPTYADFLQNRFQSWSDFLFDPALSAVEREAQLAKLSQEIQEQLIAFNRSARMTPYEFFRDGMKAPVSITHPTLFTDHVWTDLSPKHVEPVLQPLEGFLADLAKWSTFPQKLWKHHESAQHLSNLAEASTGLLRKTVSQKGLVVLAMTALSTAWLIRLTRFAQSGKSYQATRTLKIDETTPHNHMTKGTSHPIAQRYGLPTSASINFSQGVKLPASGAFSQLHQASLNSATQNVAGSSGRRPA